MTKETRIDAGSCFKSYLLVSKLQGEIFFWNFRSINLICWVSYTIDFESMSPKSKHPIPVIRGHYHDYSHHASHVNLMLMLKNCKTDQMLLDEATSDQSISSPLWTIQRFKRTSCRCCFVAYNWERSKIQSWCLTDKQEQTIRRSKFFQFVRRSYAIARSSPNDSTCSGKLYIKAFPSTIVNQLYQIWKIAITSQLTLRLKMIKRLFHISKCEWLGMSIQFMLDDGIDPSLILMLTKFQFRLLLHKSQLSRELSGKANGQNHRSDDIDQGRRLILHLYSS